LRIIQPLADKAIQRSMHRYGQLSPVVIGHGPDKTYQTADGFKRLRAACKLGYAHLKARVIDGGNRALKAAIINLNTKARTIADLEMGLVIRSLHRQDRLSQVQIAVLLDRHKSFGRQRRQVFILDKFICFYNLTIFFSGSYPFLIFGLFAFRPVIPRIPQCRNAYRFPLINAMKSALPSKVELTTWYLYLSCRTKLCVRFLTRILPKMVVFQA